MQMKSIGLDHFSIDVLHPKECGPCIVTSSLGTHVIMLKTTLNIIFSVTWHFMSLWVTFWMIFLMNK